MITTQIDASGHHLIDSTTGERRSFSDQREFARDYLIEILRHSEQVEEGLRRLQGLYTGPRPVQPLNSPEEAAQAYGGDTRDYEGLFAL